MTATIVTLEEALAGLRGPKHAFCTAALHLMDHHDQDWVRVSDVHDRLQPPAALRRSHAAAWCRGELRLVVIEHSDAGDRHVVAA